MINVSIPIISDMSRIERGFLLFALDSLRRNSTIVHDVIVVSQDGNHPAFIEALHPFKARIVHVDQPFRYPDGTTRLYEWLNIGVRAAHSEWILTPTGDDSYFFPDWELLLGTVDAAKRTSAIWTPNIVETGAGNKFDVKEGRPCELLITCDTPSIPESDVLRIAGDRCVDIGNVEEDPQRRSLSHWAHSIQHRDLFWSVGGFGETPPWPEPHDLFLHDAYSRAGVMKQIISRAHVGNLKVPVQRGVRTGEL